MRHARAAMLGLLVVASLAFGDDPEESPDPATASRAEIERTREAMRLWVETRRTISQEKRDWRIGREVLQARIEVAKEEIESRRRDIADAESSITDSDRKRLELLEAKKGLEEDLSVLEEIIVGLENRTKAILPRLPDPLREKVRPIATMIPEDSENAELALSKRYLNVTFVLNEIDKFNREITQRSEIRDRPDGSQVEVTAVYVGLAQGFYLGRDATLAGIGRPGPDGWVWTEDDAAAPAIAELVGILNNSKPAAYVGLPVTID